MILNEKTMPFENEFASYKPLRRLLDSTKVQSLQSRLKIKKKDPQQEKELEKYLIQKSSLPQSKWAPDMVLAIDGSYQPVPAENGFPGAEYGYITVASVLILLNEIKKLSKNEFIDPRKFRETEKASTIDSVFPGCNVIIDAEKSAKSSMRKALFEELKNSTIFSEGETLLDTYEALLKIKLDRDIQNRNTNKPKSPIEGIDADMTYDYGEYKCPLTNETLYSTDAMRLHELLNDSGSNGEMYGQIMLMLEKLWLVHILRAFERKKWLPTLRRIAFVLDGPLACFSTWSWLNKSIIEELSRINSLQKSVNGQDLLIIGIEKSGTFYNHFSKLDTNENGNQGKFPINTAFLLSDEYIKKNIIYSESQKPYGEDTYFGRKIFYKTSCGYRIVPVIAYFNEKNQDPQSIDISQFTRLADVMNLLDDLVSSRYADSITPLISAHAEAAIPLNLGKRLFEDIARELAEKPVHG